MKVLVACPLSSRGAMGDNLRQITLDLARAGVEVSAIVPGPYVLSEFSHCSRTLHVTTPKSRPFTYIDPGRLRRIRDFIRSVDPDVLFFYGPHPMNVLIAAMRSRDTRLVYWLHDPIQHLGGRSLYAAVYEYHDRWFLGRADGVVVSYEGARSTVAARGVPADRIGVVYLGFLENFRVAPVQEANLDFIFFGRLERYKGLDVLAQALKRLREEGRVFQAVVAGPGEIAAVAPDLYDLVHSGHVAVHERYLPDSELSAMVGRARVCVLPYRDATGTQTVQIAAYHARPVVASRVGCFPEYVLDGVTGRLCDPGDSGSLAELLRDALSNPEVWARMGRAARQIWFEGQRCNRALAESLIRYLEDICQRPPRVRA